MVGSAGWRWCNVLTLVNPAASSTGLQDKKLMKVGDVPIHDCTATDFQTSVGLCTSRPPARPAKTVVNAPLDIGSTLAGRPQHATHSNTTASNARSARGVTVRTASTSSSGAPSSEQNSSNFSSHETLLFPKGVLEEVVGEKNSEEDKDNVTLVVDGASSINILMDSCATDDNLVPYNRSNNNANCLAIQNNLEKCARLNQYQDPIPWFSRYGEDMYDHVTRGLIYIESSIPGPGIEINTFQQMPHGCNCQEDCSKGNGREVRLSSNVDASFDRSDDASDIRELVHMKTKNEVDRNCSTDRPEKLTVISSGRECVAQNGWCSQDGVPVSWCCSCSDRTPASYRNGLLVQPNLPWPIYECNDDCHCPSSASPCPTISSGCQNRVVQRGPRRDLVIRKAKGNSKQCLTKGGGDSSVVCDCNFCNGNGLCNVATDSQKNLCKGQVLLWEDPEGMKRLSDPVASCQNGESTSLSFTDQAHQSDPREVSLPKSVSTNSTSSPNKGLGVFTKLFIPRGSFICEYAGELIGEEEARCRFARQEREGKSNYILVLREFYGEDDVAPIDASSTGTKRVDPKYSSSNHSLKYSESDALGQDCNVAVPNRSYSKNASTNEISTKQDLNFLKKVRKQDLSCLSVLKPTQVTIIDPTSIGNIGRYLNHSCDPNTHVVPVRVNSVIPVAAIFAVRDVLPGEELVYDYGSVREAAAMYWPNGQPTHAAGDVEGRSRMSDNAGDCCKFGLDRSKSIEIETRESLDLRGANAASFARLNSLDASKMTDGLEKRTIKHDHCWGQLRSTEKKQKLDSTSSSGSVEVKAMGSRTDKLEWVIPMAIFDLDRTRKSPCLCGAQNCRGYLPAEVDLF